jgi:Flp pilus assembly protein TadD
MARPANPRAITNLANQLKLRGRVHDAVALYRRAIRVEPGYALAHRNLAFALEELGDVEGAVREHRIAIRLNPRDPGWLNDLGLLLVSLGREEEAIPVYSQAIRRRPQRPESATLHFNLATAYQRLGRQSEARAELRRALELDPGHRPSLDRLAEASVASGGPDP